MRGSEVCRQPATMDLAGAGMESKFLLRVLMTGGATMRKPEGVCLIARPHAVHETVTEADKSIVLILSWQTAGPG